MVSKKKACFLFLTGLIFTCAFLWREGYSEDQRTGFYAGPLSVAAKTVIEKSKSTSEQVPEVEEAEPEATNPSRYRGITRANKSTAADFQDESPLSSPL